MNDQCNINQLLESKTEESWKLQYERLVSKLDKWEEEENALKFNLYTAGEESSRLGELQKLKYEVMSDERLKVNLKQWQKRLHDSLWMRRIQVLLKSIELIECESAPTISSHVQITQKKLMESKAEVDGKSYNSSRILATLMENPNRDERKNAFNAANQLGEDMRIDFQKLIEARNAFSKEKGFDNYVDYRFSILDLNFDSFSDEMDALLEQTSAALTEWKKRISNKYGWDQLHFYDLLYVAFNYSGLDPNLFPAERVEPAMKDFLGSTGYDLNQVPIDYTIAELPFGGLMIPVNKNHVKVAVNERDGHSFYLTSTHETGHAMYEFLSSNKYPELFRNKSIIGHEAMSELFQMTCVEDEFLTNNFNLTEEQILQVKESYHLTNLFQLQFFYCLSLLEREIYNNPSGDYSEMSRVCMKKVFGIDDVTSHPASEHIFIVNPTYLKDYIYANGARDMLLNHYNINGLYGEKAVLEDIRIKFMEPSERYSWQQRVEKICSEPFTFKYLGETLANFPEK